MIRDPIDAKIELLEAKTGFLLIRILKPVFATIERFLTKISLRLTNRKK
jgi:hypothetical protein